MAGIHHITLIARKVQANVDFYAGFLGLRLVKRTGGFEDAAQLHLIYGDAIGSPGTLVTFLVWEDGSPGRVGYGQPSEIALAVPLESIGYWLTRAMTHNVAVTGPAQEFGEPVLRFHDPDGVIVKLVGVRQARTTEPWTGSGIPAESAIRSIHAATVLTEQPEATAQFLQHYFGCDAREQSGTITRLTSPAGDHVDVRDASGFWSSAPGTGTIDHIAFRADDIAAVSTVFDRLIADGADATAIHDRKYFHSIYVREPGGSLLELASDGPGMLLDEPYETLGTKLFIPPHFEAEAENFRIVLPQFGMPGEERFIYRDLPFIHRVHLPEEAEDLTLVLLHGSAGSETSLMPLAAAAAPGARLIGLRGRSTEEGIARWFRRYGPLSFDQADIRSEAEAFNAFVEGAVEAYGLDLDRTVFIGYSNGANLLAAMMQLHPGLVENAVLLRAGKVLEETPGADLSGAKILMVVGEHDVFGAHAAGLEADLRAAGAEIDTLRIDAGHETGPLDIEAVRSWLAGFRAA
ncbi:VOC family protein [Phyllobacterium sp. 0TCS1.6C]|uniref:VOC family protein n=1 Tax=unclassified Phyllobacterium TaxID=2638441 RepID=UPI00226461E3|nr:MULTISPECIES: VOC family protein [unclassified Phyllobacterium]MCX8281481.1 VOC family protein [Phyllobacterium sp. 0TCS1.6C]MCX8292923.1 VOC family protein [Phyllobacterium sp. 0TCS1.6A]